MTNVIISDCPTTSRGDEAANLGRQFQQKINAFNLGQPKNGEVLKVGWGTPARNQYFRGNTNQDKLVLELGGELYEKVLYAHAPSVYTFKIGKEWKHFKAAGGLQAGTGSMGLSQFSVIGDGRILAHPAILKGNEAKSINVDVSGVTKLQLKVDSTIEGNPQCWSIWGSPMTSR